MKLSKLSVAVLSTFSVTLNTLASTMACAENNTLLDSIYVSDTAIVVDNLQTPYSAKTYTRADIQASGVSSISDFLNQNTTVSIQPAYGNPLAPLVDMQGYGSESGHENVQIIVDGVSLNNIDLAPPQLSGIALNSVEEIAIIKGSGAVLYGNGATAGAIIITTNKNFTATELAQLGTSYGSNNTTQQTLNVKKTTSVNGFNLLTALNAEAFHTHGSKEINLDGTRNSTDNTNLAGTFGVQKGVNSATLSLAKNQSDVNYPGSMPLTEFKQNPDANTTTGNTNQTYETTTKTLTLATELNANTKLSYTLNRLDKNSTYVTYDSAFDYEQTTHKLDAKTQLNSVLLQYGLSKGDAQRDGQSTFSNNRTTRNDTAAYGLMTVDVTKQLVLSAGMRAQQFDYQYQDATQKRKQNDHLQAHELGLNYLLSAHNSVYTSFSNAFLAPNIDRFFNFGGAFNEFITPQQSQTFTLGFKHQQNTLKLTTELFYVDLSDEIYYDSSTFTNTNLDKSHKQGLNAAITQQFNAITAGADYTYVNALIDQEAGKDYSGNRLPGVSEHTLKLFAHYDFTSNLFTTLPNHRLKVMHKQGSDSFAMSDFDNANGQYPGYKSTDLSYQIANKQLNIQIGVNNLLDEDNGLYVASNTSTVVYPTQYERYYYVSANYTF
ncbi:TonB-dependent receptor [Thiomicrorhabdus aquaedulcis]|uniref:TonB-dependent receptor n=1 Tax=Thiomicrorhabdus aquaedulcis TaxID=2211106 RepID=UPI000FD8BD77|nr:TonB-dependent receptor [Thiomicrorhabdus aquaedulcis]